MKDADRSLPRLMLAATGVVFGDIGTSPLYAFRQSFVGHHKLPVDAMHVLGVLSMLIWALILIVTVKYVFIALKADNHGEGGSFALLALMKRVAAKSPLLPAVAFAAVVATALLYGDAMITPAISILSAVEGVTLVQPGFELFVVPVTLVIVAGLFFVQRYGTDRIGKAFGPIMVVWFVSIAALGIVNIVHMPSVLEAFDPRRAAGFVLADPVRAFFTLSTVVLAVTGAESLYADMGHFGCKPIRLTWLVLTLPALVACYCGQAALVLSQPDAVEQSFFRMAPDILLVPLVVLATLATVIASQSVITGAFSITQQAVQLGYLPPVRFKHTSSERSGQIYAPAINALLFVAVTGLVIGFRSSAALSSAYGLAVTGTMVLTSLILGTLIFTVWRWSLIWAPLAAVILAIDILLFAASTTKIREGGWLPIGVALVMTVVFMTWRQGTLLLHRRMEADSQPVADFIRSSVDATRVPTTAVYLTQDRKGVPQALAKNLERNHVRHERILLVTVETALTPTVSKDERLSVEDLGDGLSRVLIRYGFAQHRDVPRALALMGEDFDGAAVTYLLSRQTVVVTDRPGSGMMRWRKTLFAALMRNAEMPMTFFRLPIDQVIEIGGQVEI